MPHTRALAVLAPMLLAPAPAGSETVRAEARTLSLDCAGGDARLEGNRNVLRVTGGCRSLAVFGNANEVSAVLAGGAAVRVEGQGNRVTYTLPPGARPPEVAVLGVGSTVAAAEPRAAPGRVELLGDDLQQERDCAGRDVLIEGSRGFFRLTGGCRSVTLRGELAVVRSELQPGARVRLEGGGNLVAYTLARPGAAPAVSISGEGSRAMRFAQPGP